MALKTDKAVQVFTAAALGKMKKDDAEFHNATAAITELAKNPSPENRYEIAQLTAFTVQNVMQSAENFLALIADQKNVAAGEKAEFKVRTNGIKAFVQAKDADTQRSKISNRYFTVNTVEVSARPYVNYEEMASGRVDFSELVTTAANEMTNAKLRYIEKVLTDAISGGSFSSPVYASGSGIVKATIDPQITHFSRLGKVSIVGDLEIIQKFNGIAGYAPATGAATDPSDAVKDEILRNGRIGYYNGANIVQIINPLVEGTTDTVLSTKWVYLIPTGVETPLKVVNEGTVTSVDQTHAEDNSYEMYLRQKFGAAVVVGNFATIGAYQDISN